MSAARDLLDDLAVIGATIEPVGDRLILRAGATGIPAPLVGRVRRAKSDLLAILAVDHDRSRREQERAGELAPHQIKSRTFEACVVDWLNQHPAASAPGRCAWCGRSESPGAVVLPFGTEPGTHTWLHADCWPAWHQSRLAEAARALKTMSIEPNSCHER
jgi:hypothetical protein